MTPEPPMVPNFRVPLYSAQDRDNFVTNLVTVLAGGAVGAGTSDGGVVAEVPLSPPAAEREPVLTLDEIKLHCHIEPDQDVEDTLLLDYERAAHIHTENVLRRPGELDSKAPENVKVAMLVLIAHWYRNRETSGDDKFRELPLAYSALIATETEYSEFY